MQIHLFSRLKKSHVKKETNKRKNKNSKKRGVIMKIELNETEIDSIVLALDQRTEYLQEMFKNERDEVLKTLTKDYQDLKKKILEAKEWKVKQ